jgi:hypothetical protein
MSKLKELGIKLANHLLSAKVMGPALLGIAGVMGWQFIDEETAFKLAEWADGLIPEFGVEE